LVSLYPHLASDELLNFHISLLSYRPLLHFKQLGRLTEELMRQCNGKVPPTKALVKGLAKELIVHRGDLLMNVHK
jgi:hypothetical protein